MIWLIRKHPYTAALIYFKKIFHFLTFQTSKLPRTVAKKRKNMTSFPCSVRSADFLPYIIYTWYILYNIIHNYIIIYYIFQNKHIVGLLAFKSFIHFTSCSNAKSHLHFSLATWKTQVHAETFKSNETLQLFFPGVFWM